MSTATDGEALLRAILDGPGDDLVRLAYADWLEETGDDLRAEFVRLQLAERTEVYLGGDVWMQPTSGRAAELARGLASDWSGLPPGADPSRWQFTFRRGFVESVCCPLACWLAHGPAVVRAHPVTRVELTDVPVGRHAILGRWYLIRPAGATLPGWLHTVAGRFDSRRQGEDALSERCLAWAKGA